MKSLRKSKEFEMILSWEDLFLATDVTSSLG